MPSNGQIVPQYLHPHVATYINDNTIFQETTAVAEEGQSIICVFTSGKGRDGVLLSKKSIEEFVAEYGYPNYRTDGQPIYNAIAALSSGQVSVNCMRVMPEDAAYANIVVLAKVKKDDVEKKLTIKHEVVCHNNLVDGDSLETVTDALEAAEDEQGFVTIPLFAFRSIGRGTYGNAFSVRTSGVPQSDRDNGFKTFRFEIFESTNGFTKVELFEGSLFVDAVLSTGTAYIEDVMNDTVSGSQKINMYVSPTALDRIYAMYKEVKPESTLRDWEFDLLNGTDLTNKAIPGLEIVTEGNPLLVNEGLRLSYGTDGSFDASSIGTKSVASNREDAINQMYIKAFKGELDRTILSKRRMPTLALFDANYAQEVKRAMVDLCIKRKDFRLYLDAGLITTLAEATSYGNLMESIDDIKISKEFQHYTTKDPFTNKNMTVTTTYFLIKELVKHICVNGAHIPFTGENYAKLSGHVRNSLLPVVDVDDLEVKEELYNLRMNYYEAIAENTFVRATQSTSQSEWSDLSEESNCLVLLEMQNLLEDLVYSLTYNFASAEERTKYTEDATRLLEPFQGKKVEEATVYFDMNAWEAERSIIHCYLAVKFRGITKRGIIEIDINKRA